MSILSTMLITTTLASSLCVGTLPENCEIFQSGNYGNVGYIIGGASADCTNQIQEILDKLGISKEDFGNCIKPSLPNKPETETPELELPDTEKPDNNTPEVEIPDNNAPDNNSPEVETPDTETPDIEVPDNNVPDTETPDNSGSEEAPQLSLAEQVVALVNEERAAAGLNPLTINDSSMSAALVRAKEIRQSFSHTRPNGSSFSTALKEQGVSYRGSGENIAYGQRSPEEVMNAWMNSSGHRANILNEKYTSIGVGCYEQNGILYWTQLFIY